MICSVGGGRFTAKWLKIENKFWRWTLQSGIAKVYTYTQRDFLKDFFKLGILFENVFLTFPHHLTNNGKACLTFKSQKKV